MRVSKDVERLNPHLKRKQLRGARLTKQDPPDYGQMLYDACIRAGLPVPQREVPFAKVLRINFRADFGWAEERILVEINGQIWRKGGHTTGSGLIRDYFKANLADLLGFRLFSFSPSMVEDGTALVVLRCAFGLAETFEVDWKAMWQSTQPKRKRRAQNFQ